MKRNVIFLIVAAVLMVAMVSTASFYGGKKQTTDDTETAVTDMDKILKNQEMILKKLAIIEKNQKKLQADIKFIRSKQ